MASNFQPMSMPSACAFRMTAACAIGFDDRGPRRFGRAGTVGRLNQATKRAGATLLFPEEEPGGYVN